MEDSEHDLAYDGRKDDTGIVPELPGRESVDYEQYRTRSLTRIIRTAETEHRRLEGLMQVAQRLSGETDMDFLLSAIVEEVSGSMHAERASIFLCDWENNELYIRTAQGLETREIRMPINAGLAGHVAMTGEIINIEDAYLDDRFNQDIDRETGYRTREVLCVPLRDRRDKVIGVLEVLNHLEGGPFVTEDIVYMEALAGIITVSLENVALYKTLSDTLESLLEAASQAIDDRDPVTSGHSDRVTRYSLALAHAIHECDTGVFAPETFTRARIKQLRYAGKLHDWGKISTSEYVLTKNVRLPNRGIDIVLERLRRLKADDHVALLQRALAGELSADEVAVLHEQTARSLDAAAKFLGKLNHSGYLSDTSRDTLNTIYKLGYLTDEEMRYLSISKGNLTDEEWIEMRSHAEKTLRFLKRIQWPDELKDIPAIAAAHHERLDGSGYPLGLTGDKISLDGKIMAVADVYDALTSHDRPYKHAIPHDKAKAIMYEMVDGNHLMRELVDLFFEKECWTATDTMIRNISQEK